MSHPPSVTQLLADLQAGREVDAAQQAIWDGYFARVAALARVRLAGAPRGAEDEEDVALSALDSFFGAVQQKRLPNLADRDNLWAVLASITARKAINQRQRQLAAKRGGGRVLGGSQLESPHGRPGAANDQVGPDDVAALRDACGRMLDLLDDDAARRVARMKLEGRTNDEIATALGVSPRTVERKLSLVRKTWLLADA